MKKPLQAPPGVTLTADIEGPCPFCRKGTVCVDWEEGVLLHSMPMCLDFENRTADDFIRDVIAKRHTN